MSLVTSKQLEEFRARASKENGWSEEQHQLLDIVVTLTAAIEHPDHKWVWQEPADKAPVIDCEGRVWQWAASEPDMEPDDRDWVRQVMTRRHQLVFGPSIGDEWNDVMQYAPIRLAEPTDNIDQWVTVVEPVEADS